MQNHHVHNIIITAVAPVSRENGERVRHSSAVSPEVWAADFEAHVRSGARPLLPELLGAGTSAKGADSEVLARKI